MESKICSKRKSENRDGLSIVLLPFSSEYSIISICVFFSALQQESALQNLDIFYIHKTYPEDSNDSVRVIKEEQNAESNENGIIKNRAIKIAL